MPKGKSTKPEGAEGAENTGKPEGTKIAKVFSPDGTLIRSYTLEVHGENFASLAKQFAGKVAGRKVVEE